MARRAAVVVVATALHAGQGVLGAMPARPSSVMPGMCPDPIKGEGFPYEPVCAEGYFRCCSTCREAPCFNNAEMELSWRGYPECIRCEPGDFCPGCDVFFQCPVSTRPGREGPRVSQAGAIEMGNCEACAPGTEASLDLSQCVPRYSDKCDKRFVQRCMRGCESEDITRRKELTPCEEMKCMMYCAKQWSQDCVGAMESHCRYITEYTPPTQNSLAMLDEGVQFLPNCDVDCSGAFRGNRAAVVVATVFVVLSALLER
eukprot:TRINITY_DN4735_c0_g1_i2.p1 TRINITY_DN4735_c0_g1~~TRINITY_DN4735_c0_g1_i2.p1  ORF type:complete len:289 (-),score=38.49 TRINITY_DN4735_c0_g1_i2:39-812(-)